MLHQPNKATPLGLEIRSASLEEAPAVTALSPGGVAYCGGLKVGDVLLEINGKEATNSVVATQLIQSSTSIRLRVRRKQQQLPQQPPEQGGATSSAASAHASAALSPPKQRPSLESPPGGAASTTSSGGGKQHISPTSVIWPVSSTTPSPPRHSSPERNDANCSSCSGSPSRESPQSLSLSQSPPPTASTTVLGLMNRGCAAFGWVDAKHEDGVTYNLVSVANGVFVVRFLMKVRESSEVLSPVVGTLAAGARVHVLDRTVLLDGTLRWCVGKVGDHGNLQRLGGAVSTAGLTLNVNHAESLIRLELAGVRLQLGEKSKSIASLEKELSTMKNAERARIREATTSAEIETQVNEEDLKTFSQRLMEYIVERSDAVIELFRSMDDNGDNRIDRGEWRAGVLALGVPGAAEHLDEINDFFDMINSNGDQFVDYNELRDLVREAQRDTTAGSGGKRGAAGARGPGSSKQLKRAQTGRVGGGEPADKKKEKKEKVVAVVPMPAALLAEWGKWLGKTRTAEVVMRALNLPHEENEAFMYVKSLDREQVLDLLTLSHLDGLIEPLWEGIVALKEQAAASGRALNEQYQQTGKFAMAYAGLDKFFGGLEQLLGPPQMTKDPEQNNVPTLLRTMELEHTSEDFPDTRETFTSSNGVTTTSAIEWEFVVKPDPSKAARSEYPERKGFREAHPEWCRSITKFSQLKEDLEENANRQLREQGHSELIDEELIAVRMYTGPVFQKYNAVLRAKSRVPFMVQAYKQLCKKNSYVTSIHAISSAVIKLSKLTTAGYVYRGVCYGKFGKEFWEPNAEGICGGVEYGFSSMTREREQAMHYAKGGGWAKPNDAMTLFEAKMGMIDRGAELTWLSQYPHEAEVLFPPLTGFETVGADVEVDGGTTLMKLMARLSVNMGAQTLDQVLSRRRKMLMDMANGIKLELHEQLKDDPPLVDTSVKLLGKAFEYGAMDHDVSWFNDDDNFAAVMQETLYLQRLLLQEVRGFHDRLGANHLDLRNWKARGPARVMLLAAWLRLRTNKGSDASIDLRGAHLKPADGPLLAKLLEAHPVLTAIDVRNNETLGKEGAASLVQFITGVGAATPGQPFRSICGVTPANSRLLVASKMEPCELSIVAAELCGNVWGEAIGSSMGDGSSGKVSYAGLNRRGTNFQREWNPLIWSCKVGNDLLPRIFVESHGLDVDFKEDGKNNGGFCAAAYAVVKGRAEALQVLAELGADLYALDKHGQSVRDLAVKKRDVKCLATLDQYAPVDEQDEGQGGTAKHNGTFTLSGWV